MKHLKILFQARADLFDNFGGDTVQITRTTTELERLGHSVDLSSDPRHDVSPYDLVHVFNLLRAVDALAFVQNARRHNKPVVISPIYWNTSEYEEKGRFRPPWRPGPADKPFAAKRVAELEQSYFRLARRLALLLSDMILPLGLAEWRMLQNDFLLGERTWRVVHNGSDLVAGAEESEAPQELAGLRGFVFCPGRIEDRKNQLNLLQALHGTGLHVVIAGAAPDPDYFFACQQESDSNVTFLPRLSAGEMMAAYKQAKVVATPSWFEVASLANLEAALAGCNLVTTDRSTAPEYFGDLASYCDPGSAGSIRDAVMRECGRPENAGLQRLVSECYTWEKAALETSEAYRRMLAGERLILSEREESKVEAELSALSVVVSEARKSVTPVAESPGAGLRMTTGPAGFDILPSRLYGLLGRLAGKVGAASGVAGSHKPDGIVGHLRDREAYYHDRAFYAGEIGLEHEPAEMKAGRLNWMKTMVANRGTFTWPSAHSDSEAVNIAFRWRDSGGRLVEADGKRTVLPYDLLPGESVSLLADVIAPCQAAEYTLEIHLVHEGSAWFSDKGVGPATVRVRVI